MDSLEAEIAVTALRATGEFKILRKLNLEKESSGTDLVDLQMGKEVL